MGKREREQNRSIERDFTVMITYTAIYSTQLIARKKDKDFHRGIDNYR